MCQVISLIIIIVIILSNRDGINKGFRTDSECYFFMYKRIKTVAFKILKIIKFF